MSKLATQVQGIQAYANELGSGLPIWTIFLPDLVGKAQQLLCYRFGLGKAIRPVLGEDIPDCHQQLAGNGNNGFVVSQAWFQAGQFRLPVRMRVSYHLRRLDQDRSLNTYSVSKNVPDRNPLTSDCACMLTPDPRQHLPRRAVPGSTPGPWWWDCRAAACAI